MRTLQKQDQVASANVVGGDGSGSEYSAEVEQEANQANIGCVIAAVLTLQSKNRQLVLMLLAVVEVAMNILLK